MKKRIFDLFLLMMISFPLALEGRTLPAPTSPVRRSEPFIDGVNFCSWWHDDYLSEYSTRSVQKVAATGNEFVAILVTWYQADERATTITLDANKTPSDAAVIKAINDAKGCGLKVALKPHVDLYNGEWRGYIGRDFSDTQFAAFFATWFSSYKKFVNHYVSIAATHNVDMLFAGTEYVEILKKENGKTIPAWVDYFNEIRQTFKGNLTYCADRAHWHDVAAVGEKSYFVPFWQALDYIGIDAYYSLGEAQNLTVQQLVDGWSGPTQILQAMHTTYKRPILFTEIGYRSIERCHHNPWDYAVERPVSQECQRNCYEAFYEAFSDKSWLAGIFWWNWTPFLKSDITNPQSPAWVRAKLPGYEKDYTPEGKLAEEILKSHNSLKASTFSLY